jgi:hypothetical protein
MFMRIWKIEIAGSGVYDSTDNPKIVSTKDIKEIGEFEAYNLDAPSGGCLHCTGSD